MRKKFMEKEDLRGLPKNIKDLLLSKAWLCRQLSSKKIKDIAKDIHTSSVTIHTYIKYHGLVRGKDYKPPKKNNGRPVVLTEEEKQARILARSSNTYYSNKQKGLSHYIGKLKKDQVDKFSDEAKITGLENHELFNKFVEAYYTAKKILAKK